MYVNYFMQALQNIKVLNSFLDTRSLLHFSNNLKTTIWTNQAEIASTLVVCVSILFADVIFISHFCLITPVGPSNQFPSTFTHFLPPSSIFIHFIHFCLISPAGWGKERGGGSAVMLNPSWTHAISFCVAHSGVCFHNSKIYSKSRNWLYSIR